MTILVALILTALTFVFVTYPLFKPTVRSEEAVADDQLSGLYSKRDTAYSMLKELEFDRQSGLLTEDDYQDLAAKYKGRAISILRDIDELVEGPKLEDEIERQVKEMRRGKGVNVEGELEKEVLELRRSQGQFCPQCGAESQKDDRFCSHCGAPLSHGGDVD